MAQQMPRTATTARAVTITTTTTTITATATGTAAALPHCLPHGGIAATAAKKRQQP